VIEESDGLAPVPFAMCTANLVLGNAGRSPWTALPLFRGLFPFLAFSKGVVGLQQTHPGNQFKNNYFAEM